MKNSYYNPNDSSKLSLPNTEWKKILPDALYQVSREKGTERPWSSEYESFHEKGTYHCALCGNALFISDTKFDSGCGWPSFYEPISETSVIYKKDTSHGMIRTEVLCGKCDAHLGHVFNDGPAPTHLRFCMNGIVLQFEKK